MPIYRDDRCILRTGFLVAAWTYNGTAHEDGEYFLHVLLQVGAKRERAGWGYPTAAARDAALQALGAQVQEPWEETQEEEESS